MTTPIPVDWWDSLEPPEGLRAEIIQGDLVLSPSASKPHALVLARLLRVLDGTAPDGYVAITGLEWRLVQGTVVASAPIPDVMVVAEAGEDVRPILAVEVLCPSDRQRLSSNLTRIEGKRLDYAAHGLPHYLEIDLAAQTIVRYRLADGAFMVIEEQWSGGVVTARWPFPYELTVSDLFR